ncbi:hypothetical protein AwErysi_05770 [Erysipelotrichaceae bacterium]|nr:hypothetical protein AwErysi_05770 [Erysipelotrichaceae bacterium]
MSEISYEVIKFIGDLYEENTYICIHKPSKKVVVIDPGTDMAIQYICDNNLEVEAILLTHGHIDHILKTDSYVEKFNTPVYIHVLEKRKLTDPALHLGSLGGFENFTVSAKPITFKGANGLLHLPNFAIEFFLAPGHSEGNTIFHIVDTNSYFVGDSVFKDSIGRYDLPGSNARDHLFALKKMTTLPQHAKLYSGHGGIFRVSDLEKNEVFQRFIDIGM